MLSQTLKWETLLQFMTANAEEAVLLSNDALSANTPLTDSVLLSGG